MRITPATTRWELDADPTISGRRYALNTKLSVFSFLKGTKGISCTPEVSGAPVVRGHLLVPKPYQVDPGSPLQWYAFDFIGDFFIAAGAHFPHAAVTMLRIDFNVLK